MRLVVKPPSTACAPAFALRGGSLHTVAPLEGIEFVALPRQLPAIQQLSVRAEGGAEAPSEAAVAAAQAAAAAAGTGVAAYLAARAALLEALPQGVDVAFEGVEGGAPAAVVRPVAAGALRAAGRVWLWQACVKCVTWCFPRLASPSAQCAPLGSSPASCLTPCPRAPGSQQASSAL